MTFTVERKRRSVLAKPSRVTPAPQRPMTRAQIAAAVSDIKEFARRLRPPLNQRPEAWHEDKSALVKMAERLEDAVRGDRQLKTEL